MGLDVPESPVSFSMSISMLTFLILVQFGEILGIDQGEEEADSPLGNLDDEPPSSEENIQCFGTDWVVDKKDLGIVLVTKVSVVYVLAWS